MTSTNQSVNLNLVSSDKFNTNSTLKNIYGTYANYIQKQLATYSIYTADLSKFQFSSNPNEVLSQMLSGSKKDMIINNHMARLDKHNAYVDGLIDNYKNKEKVLEATKQAAHDQSKAIFSKYNVGNSSQLYKLNNLSANEKKAQNLPFVSNSDLSTVQSSEKAVSEADMDFTSALQTANEESHRIVS
ncbi:MAG: hypothetical protein LKG27_02135 [Clostridiaceae bacterium]|jgi:hypothetical protein|nr:hypothetical protein [Clostridiaceae bacterium]